MLPEPSLNEVGGGGVIIAEVFGILARRVGPEETQYRIVWQIRLPCILLSALLGGALALSGCRFSFAT